MGSRQKRQRPRSLIQPMIGRLSYQMSRLLHLGQCDGGVMSESFDDLLVTIAEHEARAPIEEDQALDLTVQANRHDQAGPDLLGDHQRLLGRVPVRITAVVIRPVRLPRLPHVTAEADAPGDLDGVAVAEAGADPVPARHPVRRRLPERDSGDVAVAELPGAVRDALQHGVQVERRADGGGQVAEDLGLALRATRGPRGRLRPQSGGVGLSVETGIVDRRGGPGGDGLGEADVGGGVPPLRFGDDERHGTEDLVAGDERHDHPGSQAEPTEHGQLLGRAGGGHQIVVRRLGLVYAPLVIALYAIALAFLSTYRISRATHEANVRRLAGR